jgi:two-component system, NarL family, invasion response regulator UvrY
VKILIVDDHVVVREGVRRLLATMPDTSVHEAGSAHEAVVIYKAEHPDLVLLDLNLPNSSGLQLLRRLILENRAARILVLSMHSEPIYVARTLKAGARGYISKTASAEELMAAVREIGAGGRYVEREIAAQIVISQYKGDDPLQKLSTREVDIVRLLGEGKSLAAIAEAIGVSYKTVANTCSIIKGKLGVERTVDLIRLVYDMREQ